MASSQVRSPSGTCFGFRKLFGNHEVSGHHGVDLAETPIVSRPVQRSIDDLDLYHIQLLRKGYGCQALANMALSIIALGVANGLTAPWASVLVGLSAIAFVVLVLISLQAFFRAEENCEAGDLRFAFIGFCVAVAMRMLNEFLPGRFLSMYVIGTAAACLYHLSFCFYLQRRAASVVYSIIRYFWFAAAIAGVELVSVNAFVRWKEPGDPIQDWWVTLSTQLFAAYALAFPITAVLFVACVWQLLASQTAWRSTTGALDREDAAHRPRPSIADLYSGGAAAAQPLPSSETHIQEAGGQTGNR